MFLPHRWLPLHPWRMSRHLELGLLVFNISSFIQLHPPYVYFSFRSFHSTAEITALFVALLCSGSGRSFTRCTKDAASLILGILSPQLLIHLCYHGASIYSLYPSFLAFCKHMQRYTRPFFSCLYVDISGSHWIFIPSFLIFLYIFTFLLSPMSSSIWHFFKLLILLGWFVVYG